MLVCVKIFLLIVWSYVPMNIIMLDYFYSFMKCNNILGKILTDETPLSEYNIDEKKFIVVMVTKSKPPEKTDSGDAAAATTTRLVPFNIFPLKLFLTLILIYVSYFITI